MRCIIVDDEPLAREAIELPAEDFEQLTITGKFNNAASAAEYIENNRVDLIFLDICMPGTTGLEFAHAVPKNTLVIFTTAYAEYALDSYEVDAVDYLVKPVLPEKFKRAVVKAVSYHDLLISEEKSEADTVEEDYFFVKSDRKFVKIGFTDILFIEGLKDYIVLQMTNRRIITKMTIKSVSEILPQRNFMRVNRSYIVNTDHIESFDANDIFIGKYEIAIGISYREKFFEEFLHRKNNR
ncbi:MAG: LytTR family DNA-binding domain-containing protein [Rikenellaceae bacterium]|nr:LytTR family DNA-binding domain-containing protein [Rikenellaceae bacterium]